METKIHKFTVVAQATQDDKDVQEYKAKEVQAKRRAEARAKMEAQTKTVEKNGLSLKYVEGKTTSPLAKALVQAMK